MSNQAVRRLSMEDEEESAILLDTFNREERDDAENGLGPELDTSLVNRGYERDVRLPYILALTCSVGGLQVVWSVVLSNGTPYLISLGLPKALTALVWVAAPLCGVFIQPLIGILSDSSRSRHGRRRPFIVMGTLGAIVSMLILAWIKEIAHGLFLLFNPSHDADHTVVETRLVLSLAVILVYALNIAIQPLQVGIRALSVENCPAHQQSQASAWASYLVSAGNILGYCSGLTSLPHLLHTQSISQFQALSLIASLSLLVTVTITCLSIHEKPPSITISPEGRASWNSAFRRLATTYQTMPPKIRRVCEIQFFAWMGWFPFLYYATTYVAEIYTKQPLSMTGRQPLHTDDGNTTAVGKQERATQVGTQAYLFFAIIALSTNILLSHILRPSSPSRKRTPSRPRHSSLSRKGRFWRAWGWLKVFRLTIPQAWTCAHIFFAVTISATIFVDTWTGATALVSYVGVAWAMTLWAPFAIIGEEIAVLRAKQQRRVRARVQRGSDNEDEADALDGLDEKGEGQQDEEDQAGAIIGIHNVAISAPQVVAALLSAGVFAVEHAVGGDDGTGWALRVGACATFGAAYLTATLGDS